MAIASDLEKGNYFIYNGGPVRVVRKEVVSVGTHSHTKLKLFIQGLREKGERNVILQHSDRVDKVDIMRKQGQIISKSGNKVQLMDAISYETLDSNLSPELGDINEGDTVTFIELNGAVEILDKR
jgi:translation initiation factor 5A